MSAGTGRRTRIVGAIWPVHSCPIKEAIGAGWPSIRLHLAGARRVGERYGAHMPDATTIQRPAGFTAAITRPPESIEQPALTIDEAANLMTSLGFVAFRTPPGEPVPDSCLMVMIRDAPTRHHFDPEAASYWVLDNGRGRTDLADRGIRTPVSRPYSWGRIRLVDRLGARNSFVSFGGWLTAERVGNDALLLIFRSPAPILRLPGHSQQRDHLSDEVLAFFGRVVPRLWSSPTDECLVGSLPPDALYAAFLLDQAGRVGRSTPVREAMSDGAGAIHRELELAKRHRPDALAAGLEILSLLELEPVVASVV
jgi:hypothetical protein